jgi:aspartyl/asparaginyl beta-hydroxylase (cupin superfamily)
VGRRVDGLAFLDSGDYPELALITHRWEHVRAEALASSAFMSPVDDVRTATATWTVLPFKVEADDAAVFGEDVCAVNRSLAPLAVGLVERITGVEAYSFSNLAAGGEIAAHRHHREFATAALCLVGGSNAVLYVGEEQRVYCDGEWLIFDYTKVHRVVNGGPLSRLVLLVLLPLRR